MQGAKSFFGNGYRGKGENNFRNTPSDRQDRGDHTANWMNGNTPLNLKGRLNAAKTGYKQQGKIDDMDSLNDHIEAISQTIKKGRAQNKEELLQACELLKGYAATLKRGAQGQISQANNKIYKGQQTGVMGTGQRQEI